MGLPESRLLLSKAFPLPPGPSGWQPSSVPCLPAQGGFQGSEEGGWRMLTACGRLVYCSDLSVSAGGWPSSPH